MRRFYGRVAIVFCFFALVGGLTQMAEGKSYVAYISDSPAAASAYWVTKDAGFFQKHGLDVDLIFIDGSTRGIQTLISGGVPFTSAVGTAVAGSIWNLQATCKSKVKDFCNNEVG